MARTKGKGSKAIFRRDSSPPPKPNSPFSSSSSTRLTPPSSFIYESPVISPKGLHATSLEQSSIFKESNETLVETNPLAMIIHPMFPIETFLPSKDGVTLSHLEQISENSFLNVVAARTHEETISHPKKPSKSDPLRSKPKPKFKSNKSKSSPALRTRRSQRLLSGFGTKKTPIIDTNVYEIVDSDEEEVLREKASKKTHEIAAQSTPQKAPKKSLPKKEVSKTTSPKNPPKIVPSKADKGKGKADSEKSAPKTRRHTTQNLSLSRTKRIPLMDLDLHQIFKEKWSSRPIVPGRYFDFIALEAEKIMMRKYTDALGWTKFLQIRERHYPKLVRAFFFQAKVYPDKALIVSKIKGIEISLTPESLGKILSLPTDGNCLSEDNWNEKLELDMEFVYNNTFEPNTTDFTASNLQKIPKMLNSITQYNIYPRKGSFDTVSKTDLMILYHLLFGERLNLPSVIIHHMITTSQNPNRQCCVPYGMLLTKVFQKFKIPLEDENSLLVVKKYRPKNIRHMKNKDAADDISKKRKREDTGKSILKESQPRDHSQEQTPILEEHGALLSNFQTQASSMAQATDVLQSFATKSVKATKVSKFSHLFVSPPKTDLSALFKPDDISKFFNQAAFETSVPMSSLHTIQSTCPSNFSNKSKSDPKSVHTDERPPKRSKMEKNTSKTRDDIRRLFENQVHIMNHLNYYTQHNQIHTTWQTSALSFSLNFPPPTDIPVQPPSFNLHVPDISSSSDASSPTAPTASPPKE